MKEFKRRCANDVLFDELVQFGRLAAKAWWMRIARKSVADGSNGGYNYWWAVMKNQYGWSDKTEITDGKPVSQLSRDELTDKLAELTRKIKKVPDRLQLQEFIEDATVN